MSTTNSDIGTRKRKSEALIPGSTDASKQRTSSSCPYLDTIQRSMLDFDFEPACSVTMETGPHIYGCLVCGKFFRGRGSNTPAYTHSVEESHFVFVHLSKGTFHCLPDDYEIIDPSLSDIAATLHPTFTAEEIATIDSKTDLSRDLFFGRRYLPGFVGLNNLSKTDCINSVAQALAHVPPLRDYFLRGQIPHNASKKTAPSPQHRLAQQVTSCFGELVRKVWSGKRFKSHVDPHMLVQAVTVASQNKYQIGSQPEAGEFLAWFLHQLHLGTGGGKKAGSSIIHNIFQGKVQVTTRQAKKREKKIETVQDGRGGSDDEDAADRVAQMDDADQTQIEETTIDSHFLQLTLDIPEKPLFRDEEGGLVIPQEPLISVLKKFDGVTFSDVLSRSGAAQRRRYKLRRLPTYLILHLARFTTNRYIREKNPTIVIFPVKNLDLKDYVFPENGRQAIPTEEQVRNMSVKELKQLLQRHGRKDLADSALEKPDLINVVLEFVLTSLPDLLADKYDLVANITHESPPDVGREGKHDPLQEGSYKCHVQHRGSKQWYEIQDLHVQEVMPQQIGLSESYVLIFERKSAQLNAFQPS